MDVKASKKAVEIAKENGVSENEIKKIEGSGEEGRILVKDIRSYVEAAERIDDQVEVTQWAGKTNYECTFCKTKTLHRSKMIEHLENCYPEG